jgi:hypothetical protein
MKTLRDYLRNAQPEQYHIFDSHQEQMIKRGMGHKDQDYVVYSYNIHKNSKPKAGDAFLYRRPGKSTKNRKFNIYGGGVVKDITDPDSEGNVFAIITLPFKLKEPLEQKTNEFLENFEWTSKKKKKGTWEHFWNQYGMNVIDEHDFWGLVGDQEYVVPGNTNPLNPQIKEAAEELIDNVEEFDIQSFQINIEAEEDQKKIPEFHNKQSYELTGKHINYEKLQSAKTSIGKAGEYLVLEMLREEYEGTDAIIEHVAETEGDGCGYDIRITFPDNKEMRIEVKTTKSEYIDGFYLTPRELNAARQCLLEEASKCKSYYIYRVYNFDPINKTANIKIFDHFNDADFRLAPTCWKVHIK